MLRCKSGSTLLFIGDSITDAGRTNHAPPLGEGYLAMVHDILQAEYPQHNLTVINSGISGNTIEGLDLRWDRDCLSHNPDWIFIFIGINDAHVTLAQHRDPEQRVQHFKALYRSLIDRSKAALPNSRIVLMTPYYIHRDQQTPIFQMMLQYVHVVEQVAFSLGLPVLNTQRIFDAALADQPEDAWSADSVHPFPNGHQLIADLVLHFLENHEASTFN
jgi:lysophospholipase L1-like esterase